MQDKMEIAKRILFEFEKKYDPFMFGQDTINFPTWVLVREKLYKFILREILEDREETNYLVKSKKKNTVIKLKNLIKRSFDYSRKKNLINKKVDVLFISNSYFRRGKNSENIFIDGILKNLDEKINYLVLEIPTLTEYDKRYLNSISNKKVIPLDYYLPKGLVLLSVYNLKYKKDVTNKINKVFNNASIDTVIIDDIIINENILINFIRPIWIKETLKFIAWKRSFSSLFNRMEPTSVIDIANAGRFAKSIYRENVNFYEIQHGIIHPFHLAYIYPKLNSVREGLTSHKKMILYGNYYRRLLSEQSNFDEDNLFVIGNPSYSSFNKINAMPYIDFIRTLSINPNKKIILFTSQYEPQIQLYIYEFIKELSSLINNDFIIVVRLHPRETMDSIYNELSDIDNIVFTNSSHSLHDLLSYSFVHLSISSTVLLEATMYEIPNIIINSEYSGYINRILKDNALTVDTPKDLINLIESNLLNKVDREKLSKSREDLFGVSEDIYKDIADLILKKH